jgi:hypothetical protein
MRVRNRWTGARSGRRFRERLRICAPAAAALAISVGAGFATALPDTHVSERSLAQLRFSRYALASVPQDGWHTVRPVEPAARHYAAWISGVGAAVALADAQTSGRFDDVCLVDPRTNTVTVSPAPTSGRRFRPFALSPAPLPYSRTTMAPMGCLPGDFAENGKTDFLVYYWGRSPILFMRNQRVGLSRAAYTARELVAPYQRWYTDTVDRADLTGDGHFDLIVGNYFPDGARLLDPSATSDPAMRMNRSFSRAGNSGHDRIFLWQGARRDSARYVQAPLNVLPNDGAGWTLAIGAYDLTGDLLPELYFGNDFGPDWLLYNESTPGHPRFKRVFGNGGFATPKSMVLGHDSYKGMSVDFADMTGNGQPDIFVGNISTRLGLMETNMAWINTGGDGAQLKRGRAPFSDRAESLGLARSGWSWDGKFGDFTNGGEQDLVQAEGFVKGQINLWPQVTELAMSNDALTPSPDVWPNIRPGADLAGHQQPRFFVQASPGHWANVTNRIGVSEPEPTRGVSTADIKGNGLLDFALADQWGPSHLYVNRCRRCGRALEMLLLLPTGQRRTRPLRVASGSAGYGLPGTPAIGAEVTVKTARGRVLAAQVDGGNGHASVRSPQIHLGLGAAPASEPLRVTIRWRDATGAVRALQLRLTPGVWTVRLPEGDRA